MSCIGNYSSLPAMYYHLFCLSGSECSDPTEKPQKGCGIFWHSMVRPGGVVELSQFVETIINSVLY